MTISLRETAWQAILPDTIVLAGKMGAGKDFIAAQLVERAGFTRLAFADALKAEVAALEGITVEELNARKAEYRTKLQNWGVGQRNANPMYWVEQWADARKMTSGPVVCTDARFMNEAQYSLSIGALVLRVQVPDELRIERLTQRDGSFNPLWLEHPSEQFIDQLPVHADISGLLGPSEIVPHIAHVYHSLLKMHQEAA